MDFLFDPNQFLHVMSEFVGKNVGLREFSGRSEALLELVIKSEIDVNLFVFRAIEGATRGLRQATS